MDPIFLQFFDNFGDHFGAHFGAKNCSKRGPKMGPKIGPFLGPDQDVPKVVQVQGLGSFLLSLAPLNNQRLNLLSLHSVRKTAPFRPRCPQDAPRWPQDGSKMPHVLKEKPKRDLCIVGVRSVRLCAA